MTRKKGYPFSRKTQNKMNSLFANFLTASLLLPFSLLGGNDSNTHNSSDIEKKYNFKQERNMNVGLCVFYLILSLLSVVVAVVIPMSSYFGLDFFGFGFWVTILSRLLVSIIFLFFVSLFKTQLIDSFVFNIYDVREQVLYLKDIFKYWSYSSLINVFFDVIFVVFFIFKLFYINSKDWDIYFVTKISLFSFSIFLLLDVVINLLSKYWQKRKHALISKNESYIKVMEGIRIVNPKILSELYSKNSDDKNVQFTNGGVLKIKKDVSLVNSGFSLVVNGVIKEYLFSNYIKNEIDLILRGNDVLYEMSNDINLELLKYSAFCLEKGNL